MHLKTSKQVANLLNVVEWRLRYAITKGELSPPEKFNRKYAWDIADIDRASMHFYKHEYRPMICENGKCRQAELESYIPESAPTLSELCMTLLNQREAV